MTTTKIQKGKSTLKIDNKFDDSIEKIIDKLIPGFRKEIEKEMKEIETNAQKHWLVRNPKYGKSEGSKNKFKFGVKIDGLKIVGFVENLAPYAWAIKVGKNSQNTDIKQGKRLAVELMEKPLKKISKTLTEKLINSLLKMGD